MIPEFDLGRSIGVAIFGDIGDLQGERGFSDERVVLANSLFDLEGPLGLLFRKLMRWSVFPYLEVIGEKIIHGKPLRLIKLTALILPRGGWLRRGRGD